MKILVIGSGGREHALVWKLAQSVHASKMWCAPGNPGIGQERLRSNESPVDCVALSADDLPRLVAFAQAQKVDLTVVGPDNPHSVQDIQHIVIRIVKILMDGAGDREPKPMIRKLTKIVWEPLPAS